MFASILVALSTLVGGACATHHNPPALPACVPNERGEVIVTDGDPIGCDVRPPMILVVMDPLTPCPDMGGHMDGDACVDVDY